MGKDRTADRRAAVLLATYNGEKYLPAQLDSLMDQTFKDYRVYVHDDGSVDGTSSILKDYQEKMGDRLLVLDYDTGLHGAVGNFCSLMRYAARDLDAPYIFFCDQDDVWLPRKMEDSLLEVIRLEGPKKAPALTYTDQKITDEDLHVLYNSNEDLIKRTDEDRDFRRVVFRNPACGCAMCFNHSLLDLSVRAMNEKNIVMHDWWVMLVAAACGRVSRLDAPLMLYRQHGASTLGADSNHYLKKAGKYIRHFRSSLEKKKAQTKQCEAQALDLLRIGEDLPGRKVVEDFAGAMKLSYPARAKALYRKGYIGSDNFFTLFFV